MNLGGVAAELLAERQRRGILRVSPPNLDDVSKLLRLCLQRFLCKPGCILTLQAGTAVILYDPPNTFVIPSVQSGSHAAFASQGSRESGTLSQPQCASPAMHILSDVSGTASDDAGLQMAALI